MQTALTGEGPRPRRKNENETAFTDPIAQTTTALNAWHLWTFLEKEHYQVRRFSILADAACNAERRRQP